MIHKRSIIYVGYHILSPNVLVEVEKNKKMKRKYPGSYSYWNFTP